MYTVVRFTLLSVQMMGEWYGCRRYLCHYPLQEVGHVAFISYKSFANFTVCIVNITGAEQADQQQERS